MTRLTTWVLCLALCASTSYAAAPNCNNGDAVGTHANAPGTSITVSYTRPATCNDCMLFIGVGTRSGTVQITGVTVNGNAATAMLAQVNGTIAVRTFYYANPPSGTYNVVGSIDTGPLQGHIIAMVCSGVDLSGTPYTNVTSASGTSTTPSVTVSSPTASQTLVDFVASDDGTAAPTAGADQTATNTGNSSSANAGMSVQAGSVSGGVMSWTLAVSNPWKSVGFAVNEVPAPEGGGSVLWFN